VKTVRTLIVLLAVLAPARLWACAACYGKIDAPMAEGMNWAILTLGVIIVTVLGTFLTFLIYAIRRSEALEAAKQPASAAQATAWPGSSASAILKTKTPIEEPA
jgi:heme/copper-type cytochrome/quinol oxidase subunit 2